MISFKTFLFEAAKSQRPVFTPHKAADAISLLKKHCSDALQDLRDKTLWRGDYSFKGDVFTVDPSATERKSENTSNQYTEIFDNSPLMKGYPKRGRSYIASTSHHTASGFGSDPYALIPYNGVKIGVVNQDDMWFAPVNFLGFEGALDRLNTKFSNLGLITWDDFLEAHENLKKNEAPGKRMLARLRDVFDLEDDEYPELQKDFLGMLFKAFSPKTLGFSLETTATLEAADIASEVWVGGPCVLLKENLYDQILQTLHQSGETSLKPEDILRVYKGDTDELMKHKKLFTKTARDAFDFAKAIGGRFPEGEKAIAKNAVNSYYYAVNVLKGPFPAGEKIMSKDADIKNSYDKAMAKFK